ncbi:MAG: flagellar biosynthesis protein FliQ [Nitrospirae bacterium]|jgi:flagellar biosynthetic protein FliQ|nr:flagellar biosynthesis protein FliQ [Nitrospirota bacterium]
MTPDVVREISGDVFRTILLVSAPPLMVSLLVGLIVSLFQAVTQIQEFTLTFVPKVIAVFVCLFIFFPWLSKILIAFTANLFEKIPVYIK